MGRQIECNTSLGARSEVRTVSCVAERVEDEACCMGRLGLRKDVRRHRVCQRKWDRSVKVQSELGVLVALWKSVAEGKGQSKENDIGRFYLYGPNWRSGTVFTR